MLSAARAVWPHRPCGLVNPDRGPKPEGYQVLEGVWGLFFTELVGVPFVFMAWRQHRSARAMWQVLVSPTALAVAAVAGAGMRRAIVWGVDGIISNYPQVLLDILRRP